jgi:hypothetical protein
MDSTETAPGDSTDAQREHAPGGAEAGGHHHDDPTEPRR